MGWLKKVTKQVKRAVKNVKKKGVKAFTVGQITGTDRAKLLARREEAAAAAEPGPDIAEADKAVVEMPTMNMEEIQEYRRRKLLEAQARGGRRSTIMSDESY